MPTSPDAVHRLIEREFDALSPELQRAARWLRQNEKALALRSRALLGQHWPQINGSLVVGLTLALVTLPQAVAFSVTLAGVPPHFGIYAAIWGVLFCALLNPSKVFHGGPNTAMSAAIFEATSPEA